MERERNSTVFCFQPVYMEKFQCLGGECTSNCCRSGWRIAIDETTYRKYCAVEPEAERKRIMSRINRDGEEKARLVLNDEGSCAFLRPDGFCSLQRTYGEEFLSDTCVTYPRRMFFVGEMLERGLSLTCPAAAKLVLLDDNPIVFETREEIIARPNMTLSCPEELEPVLRFLPSLQYGAVSILQNRAFSINQRLIVLGFFLDQVNDFVAKGELGKLGELSDVYTADSFGKQIPGMLSAVGFLPSGYVADMFALIESLYGQNSDFFGVEYDGIKCVVETFGIEKENASVAQLLEVYRKKFCPARKSILQQYSYIFENYLVNEFFIRHCPLYMNGSIAQNYCLFIVSYKLVEFIAICMAVSFSERSMSIKAEDIAALIERMMVYFDHNGSFLQLVVNETVKRYGDVFACMRNLLDSDIARMEG